MLLGTGTGAFDAKTDYATGSGPTAVKVADLNGDGKPDLITVNGDSNSASVLLTSDVLPTPTVTLTATSTETPTVTPTGSQTSTPTATRTATRTPTHTHTPSPTDTPTDVPPTSTPVPSSTIVPTSTVLPSSTAAVSPTRTPLIAPSVVATAVRAATVPAFIPTPNPTHAGQLFLIPTAQPTSGTGAVLNSPDNAPFIMTMLIPPGQTPQAIALEQSTAAPPEATMPAGVKVVKAVRIDVYDATTGALIHHHDPPLEIAIALSASEKKTCATDPGRIALLHTAATGTTTRYPVSALDCANGIVYAKLYDTTAYSLAELDTVTAVSFRIWILPVGRNPETR